MTGSIWRWPALLCASLVIGCAEQLGEPDVEPVAPALDHGTVSAEGEILGWVHEQPWVKTTQENLYVVLAQRTGGISSSHYDSIMWVNPDGWDHQQMFWWSDINAPDEWQHENHCRGTYAERDEELHVAPEQSGGGTEKHCVQAGATYHFRLHDAQPPGGTILREFTIDYLRMRSNPHVYHNDGSTWEHMEARTGTDFQDVYLSTVLDPTGTEFDTPVLCIDNAGETLGSEDALFLDPGGCDATPGADTIRGSADDWFRFSAAFSTHSVASPGREHRPLARLWIRRIGGQTKSTNYWTYHAEAFQMRSIRFGDLFPNHPNATFEVTLELMRPDEQPRTSRPLTGLRVVRIQPPPVVNSIVITPNPVEVVAQGGTPVSATAYDQYGQPISAVFTWSVAHTTIATVGPGPSASSHVCGVARGTTQLTAEAPNGVEGYATVNVPSGPYGCW